MNSFMPYRPFTQSLRRLLVLSLICSILFGAGCASSSGSRMQNMLRTTFEDMKQAIKNGDLKTLQSIWVSPRGETYSMETLSKYYEQNGQDLSVKIQEAKLTKTPNVFTPSPQIRRRHPKANYAGLLRVRNSYGAPKALRAIRMNNSWRIIHSIHLQQTPSDNDS